MMSGMKNFSRVTASISFFSRSKEKLQLVLEACCCIFVAEEDIFQSLTAGINKDV